MKTTRTLAGLLAAGALSLGAASTPAFADTYQIRNYGSDKCAGVNWWEAGNNGAGVVQQTCDPSSPYQQWTRDPVGGGYQHFLNAASHKCMDVTNGINADWTPIQQWTCTSTPGMAWKTPSFPYPAVPFQVKSQIGGRCLDVRGGSLQDGAVIQIYHCTANNPAQVWTIQ